MSLAIMLFTLTTIATALAAYAANLGSDRIDKSEQSLPLVASSARKQRHWEYRTDKCSLPLWSHTDDLDLLLPIQGRAVWQVYDWSDNHALTLLRCVGAHDDEGLNPARNPTNKHWLPAQNQQPQACQVDQYSA